MHQVYILYSAKTAKFYIGSTSVGVDKRLERHNQGWTRSTKSGIPWIIMFVRTFEIKSEALHNERFLKKQKSKNYLKKLIESELNEIAN